VQVRDDLRHAGNTFAAANASKTFAASSGAGLKT